MSELDFVVESSAGPYPVNFRSDALSSMANLERTIIIIDQKVADLYRPIFSSDLLAARTITAVAHEETKSLAEMSAFVEQMVACGVRKDDQLVAIGGGITQDIVAFLATIMFRGMEWTFVPTTLVSQADSCIGSKSSINAAGTKNLVGTFRAPGHVTIDTSFLSTLANEQLRSGIGEMLKVHAVSGPLEFDTIAADYPNLLNDPELMTGAIHRSLLIKRALVEIDEFDRGPRNVMNYGHSFGHAIEIATEYRIPHGIAITIGMDMANFAAARLGISTEEQFQRMHPVLSANYRGFEEVDIPADLLMNALARDKKNTPTQLRLVMPDKLGAIRLVSVEPTDAVSSAVVAFLADVRPFVTP